jgi:hypothetical protein
MRINLLKMWPINHFSSEYWEEEAAKLPKDGWRVDHKEMFTYRGSYIYYAYPPKGERVPFLGTPLSGLRRAVKYAKKMNKKAEPRIMIRCMDC